MSKVYCGLVVVLLGLTAPSALSEAATLAELQEALLDEIRLDTRETRGYTGRATASTWPSKARLW